MTRINKPILCVGDLGADISIDTRKRYSIKKSTETILKGKPIELTAESQTQLTSGGAAGNTSIVLSRLGASPFFLGKIGNDIFGKFIEDTLSKEGVDTRWLITEKNKYTVIVITYTDANGDRDFYIYPQTGSAYISLEPNDIDEDIFSKIGLIFATGLSLVEEPICSSINKLVIKAKENNIPFALDVNLRPNIYGWDQNKRKVFMDVIDNCDIIFGSGQDELTVLTENPFAFDAAKILTKGEKIVVCKLGSDGAAVFTEKEAIKMPAFPVEVINTVGAGDIFNGGFLAAYVNGKRIDECLLWGNAAAAYTIQFKDKGNVPNEEQLTQFIKTFDMSKYEIEKIY